MLAPGNNHELPHVLVTIFRSIDVRIRVQGLAHTQAPKCGDLHPQITANRLRILEDELPLIDGSELLVTVSRI